MAAPFPDQVKATGGQDKIDGADQRQDLHQRIFAHVCNPLHTIRTIHTIPPRDAVPIAPTNAMRSGFIQLQSMLMNVFWMIACIPVSEIGFGRLRSVVSNASMRLSAKACASSKSWTVSVIASTTKSE